MAVARKGTLNARQRARLAVQVDQEKIKRQVDLFTEALTAVDARDQAEIRLGHALNELRGMGLSRADIADRTGLTPGEVSAAMRAATDAETVAENETQETPAGEAEVASEDRDNEVADETIPVNGGDDQAVTAGEESDTNAVHSGFPVHAS